MSEYQYNEQAAAAYGRFTDERARWAQVLGASAGKRKQVKPARVSLLARIFGIFN